MPPHGHTEEEKEECVCSEINISHCPVHGQESSASASTPQPRGQDTNRAGVVDSALTTLWRCAGWLESVRDRVKPLNPDTADSCDYYIHALKSLAGKINSGGLSASGEQRSSEGETCEKCGRIKYGDHGKTCYHCEPPLSAPLPKEEQ